MSQLASDNFNRADANPIGGNWTTITSFGALRIVSQQVTGTASGDNGAFYNAITWPNDQYSECVFPQFTISGPDLGPAARVSASAASFYASFAKTAPGTWDGIWKVVAGTFTRLTAATSDTFGPTDVIRIECQGTTLRGKKNGVILATTTDSSISTGNAGLYHEFADLTMTEDNWAGGDFKGHRLALLGVGK